MVPAYSEFVYATDVLRLCESAFSSPQPPSAALSQGDDVTQTPPPSPPHPRGSLRSEKSWTGGTANVREPDLIGRSLRCRVTDLVSVSAG